MKKTIFAATMTALAAASGAAVAADLPRGPVPYYSPAKVYNWNGLYAGLNIGYTWGKVSDSSISPSGIAGGGQFGYNWQSSQFVFGGEADIQYSSADDTFAPYKFSNPWFGTLRGRAGYAFNNVLFFGTGGLAFGELRGETFGRAEQHTTAGWTLGFGSEVGLDSHWSAKIEYLYIDLSDSQFGITGVSNGYRSSVVRAGINYHF